MLFTNLINSLIDPTEEIIYWVYDVRNLASSIFTNVNGPALSLETSVATSFNNIDYFGVS
jgi:hypothetical protein